MTRHNKNLVTVFVAIIIVLILITFTTGSTINSALSLSPHHGKSKTEIISGANGANGASTGSRSSLTAVIHLLQPTTCKCSP